MHVKAKKTAIAGLLLAFTIVCITMGSVIETNTLFLLAAASYFVGIIYREFGGKMGAAFYIAGVTLGFIVSPNKFYILSYGAMGLYILVNEFAFRKIAEWKGDVNRSAIFWIVKYIVFNVMYLPMLLGFQELLFGRKLPGALMIGALVVGQIGLFIYDRGYEYVQSHIWNKMRGKLFRY